MHTQKLKRRWTRGEIRSRAVSLAVIASVFVTFAVDSFVRYPVPGPNEPHYLCKAKHYWSPQWCERDLFLSSSNAHIVFYQTFGLLTRAGSLETAAIVGRLLALALLASGWTALVRSVVPGKWPPLLAAWVFLGLSAVGNLSGEWLFDGIESKVVAYGLLFHALAIALSDEGFSGPRLFAAATLTGIAISFHPVVGIWGTVAAVFALIVRAVQPRPDTHEWRHTRPSPTSAQWFAAALLLTATAAPGVIAGLKSAGGSSAYADYIQVYYRLQHHLDPMHFGAAATAWWESPWLYYAVLSVCWLIGRRGMSRRDGERGLFGFVIAAALIALGGLIIGWRSGQPEDMPLYALRWKLLKFYPFRLFDVMLPIAFAMTVAGLVRRWCEMACERWNRRLVGITAVFYALIILPIAFGVLRLAPDARPPLSASEMADWRNACRWIKTNTAADSLILTPPRESWAFKWFAERAEFVNFKDCPQDARGLVEWNARLLFLQKWAEEKFEGGYSRQDTRPLHTEQGIDYIVAGHLGPFTFPPLYQNDTYRIYRLDN